MRLTGLFYWGTLAHWFGVRFPAHTLRQMPHVAFYACWLGTMPSVGKSATNRHTNRYAKFVTNSDLLSGREVIVCQRKKMSQ